MSQGRRTGVAGMVFVLALLHLSCSGPLPESTEAIEEHQYAATLPSGFVESVVASGLTSATGLAPLPDGRVLVIQQNGQVKVIKNDALLGTDFINLSSETDSQYERGLLGVGVDPGFSTNRYVYLYYTARTPTVHNRLIRVTANGDVASASTRITLVDLPDLPSSSTRWHMGGAIHFGPDGKLYLAVGDHETGQGASNPATSPPQIKTSVFGKILRFNSDGSIPTDNPFYGQTTGLNRAIYAMGLRNPFTFDIKSDGKLFISDVGQSGWEEINVAAGGGKNFGWPATEGSFTQSQHPGFTLPAHAYSHSTGCSVVGATFYNPSTMRFPASYLGKFFFADFCNGKIYQMDPASFAVTQFAAGISYPVTVDVAPGGALYYIARNQKTGTPTAGTAKVYKIDYTGSGAPQIAQQPESLLVTIGQTATFSVTASNATGYQWERHNGAAWAAITGATAAAYTLASAVIGDDGARFRCRVSNPAGTSTSVEAVLTVTGNQAPSATIVTPALASGTVAALAWEVNTQVAFSGTATDPEEGGLPASAYTWQVDFHHDSHVHPFMPATSGLTGGSFVVPNTETSAALIWYRIYLTVTDSAGRSTTSYRDLRPATFLTDLTWTSAYNGWGPAGGAPEKDTSIGGSGAGDGRPITLDGLVYPRGLGMHPASARSAEVTYQLDGACSGSLIADVGVDDEVPDTNTQASITFEVWLDGTRVWDSGVMYANSFHKPVDVSVAGRNQLKLVVTNGGVNSHTDDHGDWANARVTGCTGSVPAQRAYPNGTPWPIPGTIQSEDYDLVSGAASGEGMAYHDTTAGNNGTQYRAEDVDLQPTTDAGGGYNIGWAAAGEWLEYTVNVASAGSYAMRLRVATTAARTMHVEVDGVPTGGSLAIPSTGGYQTFQTVTALASLAAGQHVVRVVFDSGSVNLNWISFTAPAASKIAGLTVHDTANASSWSIQSNFRSGTSATGSHPWTDWPSTYVSAIDGGIAAALTGAEWIKVASASKAYTGGPQASIALAGTADVYLTIDDRWNGGGRPSWLDSGWVDTGFAVTVWESTSKPNLPLSVYRKAGASGTVTTPRIGANNAYDYFIVVK